MSPKGDAEGQKTVVSNRRARHDYEILERYETGIVLTGAEVKSLRGGRGSLAEAYARVRGHEIWLEGMHIPPYEQAMDKARLRADPAPQAAAPPQGDRAPDRQDGRAAGSR